MACWYLFRAFLSNFVPKEIVLLGERKRVAHRLVGDDSLGHVAHETDAECLAQG